MEIPGPLPITSDPPLRFRFGVLFFAGGVIPNPIDTLFQKVSGLGTTVDTETVEQGGENLYSQRLPKKIQHENLVLERGMLVGSPLVIEFTIAYRDVAV
jgi:phage tail-like protein